MPQRKEEENGQGRRSEGAFAARLGDGRAFHAEGTAFAKTRGLETDQ